MKLALLLSLVIAMLALCQGEVGTPCTSQAQCAADECCQIVNMIVASKKRQLFQSLIGPNTQGTCQKYKVEGESCSSIAVMNGFCGCAEGLRCTPIAFNQGTLGRRMELPAHCTRS